MLNVFRKVTILLTLIILTLVTLMPGQNMVRGENTVDPPYEPGELIVFFEDDIDQLKAESIVEDLDGKDTMLLEDSSEMAALIELPKGQSLDNAAKEYEKIPGVASTQPNFKYELSSTMSAASTNDKYDSKLWHMRKIDTEAAWDQLSAIDLKKTRIAILDTGVLYNHPDLKKNLNRSLCADTSSGKNTVKLKGDYDGHGTQVTGIAGATVNNGIGVAGVAGGKDNNAVEVFVVDVFGKTSSTNSAAIVRAIKYARANNAKVINMSLGYQGSRESKDKTDQYLETEIKRAVKDKITVVCSAGNDGKSKTPYYPSDFDACIGVIATEKDGTRCSFSNYGVGKNISAPGAGIFTTCKKPEYASKGGTSMAAPIVSSVVSLIYAANPNLTVAEVKKILFTTATDLETPGWDPQTGYGNVNAKNAVAAAIASRDVTGIKLSPVIVGTIKKEQMIPAIMPKSAVDHAVIWTSADPSVATVDSSGNVMGKTVGTAEITATSKSNPEISDSCTVTVGYNLSYVLNGGINNRSNPSAFKTDVSVKLSNPTKKTYTFQGWYEDNKFKTKVTAVSGADKTVYAKWQKVTVGKTAITGIKRSSNKMTVRYKKVKDARGYEIKYSTNKKFYKSTTKTSLTKQMPKTLTVKKRTKYHVKIRAFKKDSAGNMIYGRYCKAKSK